MCELLDVCVKNFPDLKPEALLKGLLHCSCCRCSMTHTYSVKAGGRRYRYYVCLAAQKRHNALYLMGLYSGSEEAADHIARDYTARRLE